MSLGQSLTVDVGGVRHVTSLATLRSRPGSMLDAMFSGNFQIEEEEGRMGPCLVTYWPIFEMECWLSAASTTFIYWSV